MSAGNFLSIASFILSILLMVLGFVLWSQNGFPTTELIPYKNIFGSNPIHLAYLGVFISSGFAIHGALKHGWFNQKK